MVETPCELCRFIVLKYAYRYCFIPCSFFFFLALFELNEALFHACYLKMLAVFLLIEFSSIFPTSRSPLKACEMWLLFIRILFVAFFFSLVPLCSGLCSFPLVFWWIGFGKVDRRIYQMERYGFRLVLGEWIDRYICRERMHPRGPWLLTWARLIYQLRLGCILCCWRK